MTNNFYKKDALTDAVKSVMEVNQFHREAEALVNEKFGVVSRKALPHEQQAAWDAEFDSIISEGAMKRMSMGDDGGMETYRKKPEGMKPKGMKMADKDYDGDGKIETSTDEWKGSRDKAIKKAMEKEQINEVGDTRKGQKLLAKVLKRATNRLVKATDPMWTSKSGMTDKDKKTASKYQDVARMADDRIVDEEQINEMDSMSADRTSPSSYMKKPGYSTVQKTTPSNATKREIAGGLQRNQVARGKKTDRLDHLEEKKLSDAEMTKREEIVKSMKKKKGDFEKRYPGRGEEVMYATATKQAKELAEEKSIESIHEEIAMNLYAELNYVMENYGDNAGDEWIANLSEEQLEILSKV